MGGDESDEGEYDENDEIPNKESKNCIKAYRKQTEEVKESAQQ